MDFYPVTREDIPAIKEAIEEEFKPTPMEVKYPRTKIKIMRYLPLAVPLLENVQKIKELNAILRANEISSLEAFILTLEEWIRENGQGNFVDLLTALNENNFEKIAGRLIPLIAQYSYKINKSPDENGVSFVYNLNAQEIHDDNEENASKTNAISIPLIRQRIFKQLSPSALAQFRLVSSQWHDESLGFWRKTARLTLMDDSSDFDDGDDGGPYIEGSLNFLPIPDFVKILNNEEMFKTAVESGEFEEEFEHEDHQVLKVPFERFTVYQGNFSQLHIPPFKDYEEAEFWNFCGEHIKDLKLMFTLVLGNERVVPLVEKLLLDCCPNLEVLEIDWTRKCSGNNVGQEEEELRYTQNTDGIASKVKKLSLRGHLIQPLPIVVLGRCPNLKELSLAEDERMFEGLTIQRTVTGEYIKLDKLSVSLSRFQSVFFFLLKNYLELNPTHSIQHLCLINLELAETRQPEFDLYSAIAHCKGLKTLELTVNNKINSNPEAQPPIIWFMDLSPFFFPNLTRFKYKIEYSSCTDYLHSLHGHTLHKDRFDFGTLKGMPELEELEVSVLCSKANSVKRNDPTNDWIYEGPRDLYLPPGLQNSYSVENPILCSKLKKFTFYGWQLNLEDIRVLSGWFPNLTYLAADISPKVLTLLVSYWEKLEGVYIQCDRFISLRQLWQLKEKKEYLQIIQKVRGTANELEVNVKNERVFFNIK